MGLDEIKREFNNLDQSEKLLIVEDLWNQIAKGNNDIPMYDWQKSELDKRYREYKKGKLELHDWNIVHNELRKQFK